MQRVLVPTGLIADGPAALELLLRAGGRYLSLALPARPPS